MKTIKLVVSGAVTAAMLSLAGVASISLSADSNGAPFITSNPDMALVSGAGDDAVFTATADGSPAPAIQWQVSNDRRGPWTDIPGATTTTLTVTASDVPQDVGALGNAYRAVFSNDGGTAASRPARLVSRAHWMRDLGSDIAQVPLNELTIPGTHDMGTYGITGSSDDSTDRQAVLCGVFHSVCEDFGRAQDSIKDATHELNEGIRYFDLRICGHDDGSFDFTSYSRTLVTCHGLEAAPLANILSQTRAWIDAHPGEVVILDLNHHYQVNLDIVAQRVEEAFALPDGGSLIIPPPYCTPGNPQSGICAGGLTLHAIGQQHLGAVIVNFVNDDAPGEFFRPFFCQYISGPCGFYIQPVPTADFYDRHPLLWGRTSAMPSTFANTTSVTSLVSNVRTELTNRGNFDPNHFYVQFLQTTPDGGYIALNPTSGLLDMAKESNPVVGPMIFACGPSDECFAPFRPENLNVLAINYYNRTDYDVRHLLAADDIDDCENGLSSCPLTPERLTTLQCGIDSQNHPFCTYSDPVHFDFVSEAVRFNAYARTAPVVNVSTAASPAATDWFNAATLGPGNSLSASVDGEDYRYPTGFSSLDCLDGTAFTVLSPGTNAPFVDKSLSLGDGTHILDCRATDGARFGVHQFGNRGAGPGSTPSPVIYRVDTTPPNVACTPAEFVLNQPAAVGAAVTDGTSGPVNATVSVAVATSGVGSFSASLTGADLAGNTAVATCPYSVSYNVVFDQDKGKPAKGGSTVTIQIALQDYFGVPLSSRAIDVTATGVTQLASGTTLTPTQPGGQGDVAFNASPSGYSYELKTTGYSPGDYTLDFVVAGDPKTYHAPFAIR